MLMAAAASVHIDSTHSSSAGSIISPPPWHPAVPVPVPVATLPTHHQAVLFDRDLTTPSPSPPPSRNHHQQLRPAAARRASRRRPRPSRKVPTTYISADPASFRRMVHQVTGADDLPPPLARPAPPSHEATTLCRPAPSRAAAAGALPTLPTLDTSALLLGTGFGSARRTTGPAASVRTASAAAAAASEVDVGARGDVGVGLGGAGYGGSDGAGGFLTLELWDALLY